LADSVRAQYDAPRGNGTLKGFSMFKPSDVTHQPAFWLAILVIGVALPMIIPNKTWAGCGALVVGMLLLGSAYGILPSVDLSVSLGRAAIFASSSTFLLILLGGNLLSSAIYSYRHGWCGNRALIGTILVIAAWLAILRAEGSRSASQIADLRSQIQSFVAYKQNVNSTIDQFEAHAKESDKQIGQAEEQVTSAIPKLEDAYKAFTHFNEETLPQAQKEVFQKCDKSKPWWSQTQKSNCETNFLNAEISPYLGPQLKSEVKVQESQISQGPDLATEPFNDCRKRLESLRSE
jgi:hypothetical protein